MQGDIEYCQAKGTAILLNLGGGNQPAGNYALNSTADAKNFALNLWNTFLGGDSNVRPFGSASLDGCVYFFFSLMLTITSFF